MELTTNDPLAIAVTSAIHAGHVDELRELLASNPNLAKATIGDRAGVRRSLLHIASDWPGHFPNAATAVTALIDAGADANAVVKVPGRDDTETPLHWAASSDDVAVVDALLDGGANIEAPGAVFTGGTPMSDAVIFAQWNAARRLLERGATTNLSQSAALGLADRVHAFFAIEPHPTMHDITNAFWHACRGGQRDTAEYLLGQGADLNWIGHEHKTPLQVAQESGVEELIGWLQTRGAKAARDL
jgi:ankyrin repeat protein